MSMPIRGIISDLNKGTDRGIISAKFHNTIAEVISDLLMRLRKRSHLSKAVFSGGGFQNMYLKDKISSLLNEKRFDLYFQSEINTNDYGIPIGQIAIANARRLCA